jgi:hypothetical protein
VVAGCEDDTVLGGVERPDLGYAMLEASNAPETGQKPKLTYEHCEKQPPIVEPVNQK